MEFCLTLNYDEITMPSQLPAALEPLIARHKDAGATPKRPAGRTMKSAGLNRNIPVVERARRSQEAHPPGRVGVPDPQTPELHTSSRISIRTIPIVHVRHARVAVGVNGGAKRNSGLLRNRRKPNPHSRANAPALERGVLAVGRADRRQTRSRGHQPSKREPALRGKGVHLTGGQEKAPAPGILPDG